MNKSNLYRFDDEDLFKRKGIAENLTDILENENIPISISIDSYWGSGKTTFIKKWMNYLNDINRKTLYLDAWEFDYNRDPIIPIIGTLEKVLNLDEATRKDFVIAFKTIVFELVKIITPITDLEKISKSLDTQERVDLYSFKNLEEEKKTIKKALIDYAGNEKVYFFIDELDRCKPIFSIKLLERIKHFLDIDNFIFVFAVDLDQLGMSVKSIYGDINTESYFRKFFDYNFHLPVPEVNTYFQFLFLSNNLDKVWNTQFVQYTSDIMERKSEVGLRECEKIFNVIRICHNKIDKYDFAHHIFPLLIIFKVIDPENYKKLLNGDFSFDRDYVMKYGINYAYSNKIDFIIGLFEVLSYGTLRDREKALSARNLQISRRTLDKSLSEYAKSNLEFADLF